MLSCGGNDLVDALRASADGVRFPNLHFFDTGAIAIEPAALGAQGVSGDWLNEST